MKTNREEMRKLLNKYIALMKVAFDNGINKDVDENWKQVKLVEKFIEDHKK